ncbi:hypothetical protein RUND412_000471 [Rhizina undulata]
MSKKLALYTNQCSGWCHRVHIALQELNLEFEEVIIDLTVPREPWYLEINPRGLVPALKYGDEIIIESAVIVNFLVDAFPSHLVPSPGDPEAALKRAKINFFVDTFISKVVANFYDLVKARDETEKVAKAQTFLESIEKEIVPLLTDAAPFFGGSKELTLAEVLTGSLMLRFYAHSNPESGLLPTFITDKLKENKTWQSWIDAIRAKESIMGIYDEQEVIKSSSFKRSMAKK